MPSGSKFVDDSFGQGSASLSAEKAKMQVLPPLSLLELKPEPVLPAGIGVGAMSCTDRSSRATGPDASKVDKVAAAPIALAPSSGSDYQSDIIKTEEDVPVDEVPAAAVQNEA